MITVPFSDEVLKRLVFKAIPRPKIIAFVGKDRWQFDQALSLISNKYCRNSDLRSFNIDYFDIDNIPKVTTNALATIDSILQEEPLSSNVRVVVITHHSIPITSCNFLASSLAIYLNPPDTSKADIVFTIFPLYGRRLKAFTRSIVKSLDPLSKYFSSNDDIDYLVSNLYAGNTATFQSELYKLHKLSVAFPQDFYVRAKEYIATCFDTRLIKLYKLLRNVSDSSSLIRFIYESIFVDQVLTPLQIFNALAQHFFINVLLFTTNSLKHPFYLDDKAGFVFDFLMHDTIYDKIFQTLALHPRLSQDRDFYLSNLPSIQSVFRRCPGPVSCSMDNHCALCHKTLIFLGCNFQDLAVEGSGNYCPLRLASVLNLVETKINKSFNLNWAYFLSSDKAFIQGGYQFPLKINPLGVSILQLARFFTLDDINQGISLFQKAERFIKLNYEPSKAQIVAIFSEIVVYLAKGQVLNELEA